MICDTSQRNISLPFSALLSSWTSAWTHTCKNACKKANRLPAKTMNAFHLQATGERDRHFSPSANCCFRWNNTRRNDVVSCPLWLQNGAEPHLSDSSYKWPVSITTIFQSPRCVSTETLVGFKDGLISVESCWSVLKRQSVTTYQVSMMETAEKNDIYGHLRWMDTCKSCPNCKKLCSR